MEAQLIRSRTSTRDRWTAAPFAAWSLILAALVWQTGTTNRVAVTGILVVIAGVQAVGVAAMWNGAVRRLAYAPLSSLLVLSAATTAYLMVDNTAGVYGGGILPLFAGLLIGLLLQLHLLRKAVVK